MFYAKLKESENQEILLMQERESYWQRNDLPEEEQREIRSQLFARISKINSSWNMEIRNWETEKDDNWYSISGIIYSEESLKWSIDKGRKEYKTNRIRKELNERKKRRKELLMQSKK
jgi:hypothetical protein